MAPSKAALAKIHIAKKELGLTDKVNRDLLYMKFHVTSASRLDDRQATVLLNTFKAKGWNPKRAEVVSVGGRNSGRYIEIKPGPAARQQRKVLAMWNQLGYSTDKLHARCRRQFQVDRFERLVDGEALHVLITDLDRRLKTKRKDH
jgi:hypothetical protein